MIMLISRPLACSAAWAPGRRIRGFNCLCILKCKRDVMRYRVSTERMWAVHQTHGRIIYTGWEPERALGEGHLELAHGAGSDRTWKQQRRSAYTIDWLYQSATCTTDSMQWRPICEARKARRYPGPGAVRCADCRVGAARASANTCHNQLKTCLSFELRANHCNAAADRKASTHDARHGQEAEAQNDSERTSLSLVGKRERVKERETAGLHLVSGQGGLKPL
jgi:hypothetical protein